MRDCSTGTKRTTLPWRDIVCGRGAPDGRMRSAGATDGTRSMPPRPISCTAPIASDARASATATTIRPRPAGRAGGMGGGRMMSTPEPVSSTVATSACSSCTAMG